MKRVLSLHDYVLRLSYLESPAKFEKEYWYPVRKIQKSNCRVFPIALLPVQHDGNCIKKNV